MSSFTENDIAALESQGRIGPDVANDWRAKVRRIAGDVVTDPLALVGAGLMPGLPMAAAMTAAPVVSAVRRNDEATQKRAERDAVPDAAPAQEPLTATAPQRQAPAPRMPGDFGLGGIRASIKDAGGKYGEAAGGAVERQRSALDDQKTALVSQADIESQKAAELASQARTNRLAVDAYDADEQERETQRQSTLTGAADTLRRLQKEAADYKITDRRSIGQKAVGAIAAALGGIGAGMLGSANNQVLDVVRQQIDDDINAQREELAGKRGAVADKRSEMGMLVDQFGSERAATAARRVQLLEGYKRYAEELAGEYAAPEAQARMQQLIAQLDEEQATHELDVLGDVNNRFLQNSQAQAGIAGTQANLAMQRAELAAKTAGSGVDNERLVPGLGVAVSKDAAKKAIELKNAADTMTSGLGKLRSMRQKHGGGFSTTLNPEDAAVGEQVAADLKFQMKSLNSLGVLSDQEYERLERITANPDKYGGVFGDPVMAAYDELDKLVRSNTDMKLKNYGLPGYTGNDGAEEKNARYGAVPRPR